MEWLEGNRIRVTPPKKPKKCTATRFASVLGLNTWSTPFEAWCAITRTWEEPFEDTIYTLAGKVIEPKLIAYMRHAYAMDNLTTPTDMYGPDYFKKTWGDFFHDVPIFGGMWDSLLMDTETGKPEAVIEFKTTKRVEDWRDDVPEYYALQAALYAYLLGVDDVIMVCAFLEDKDYEHPERFEPGLDNTITRVFTVSERYPNFDLLMEKVTKWWNDHVVTGISPAFDEKKDAKILKELRQQTVSPDTELDALVAEAEAIKAELDAAAALVAEKEKRYKVLTEAIKNEAISHFHDGIKTAVISGHKYTFTVTRAAGAETLDKEAMKADGVYEKYARPGKETFKLTTSVNK